MLIIDIINIKNIFIAKNKLKKDEKKMFENIKKMKRKLEKMRKGE